MNPSLFSLLRHEIFMDANGTRRAAVPDRCMDDAFAKAIDQERGRSNATSTPTGPAASPAPARGTDRGDHAPRPNQDAPEPPSNDKVRRTGELSWQFASYRCVFATPARACPRLRVSTKRRALQRPSGRGSVTTDPSLQELHHMAAKVNGPVRVAL